VVRLKEAIRAEDKKRAGGVGCVQAQMEHRTNQQMEFDSLSFPYFTYMA
jgi:hypothetical protein